MIEYYDHLGNIITIEEWTDRYSDIDARRVATDQLGGLLISTVLLGMDHGFGTGAPLIFESMVFDNSPKNPQPWNELDCERYSTLEEAKKGHKALVAKWLPKVKNHEIGVTYNLYLIEETTDDDD